MKTQGQAGTAPSPQGRKLLNQRVHSKRDMRRRTHTHDSKVTNMSVFRNQCEQRCARELEARMVTLLAEGSHAEIKASVTTTRLYNILTEDVPLMAFYDVKNAKLCNIYEGEGVIMFTVCSPPT